MRCPSPVTRRLSSGSGRGIGAPSICGATSAPSPPHATSGAAGGRARPGGRVALDGGRGGIGNSAPLALAQEAGVIRDGHGARLASVAAALVISRTRRHAISRLHGDSVLVAALKESLPWGCLVRIGRARADPAADPAAAVRTRSHAGHGRRARGSARAAGGRPAAGAARGSGRLGWDVRDPVLGSPANPQDGNQRGVMLWVSAG